MLSSTSISDRRPPTPAAVRTDRDYYSELWGTTTAARRRAAIADRRRRSGYVAAVAAVALMAHLGWSALSNAASDFRFEIGPASAADRPAEQDPIAEPAQQRSSSMVDDTAATG